MEENNIYIPVYIINLPHRKDRLESILGEFEGKNEFDINVIAAHQHEIGDIGLWKSIQDVIQRATNNNDDVIIICEDDHQFTRYYNKDFLLDNIIEANEQGCELLCGGISGGFTCIFPLSPHRFWVNSYWGNQFLIVFKKFFPIILNHDFDARMKVDHVLSALTIHKMVLFPFISVQKYFGYSDVTDYNNENPEWALSRFDKAFKVLEEFQTVYNFYSK